MRIIAASVAERAAAHLLMSLAFLLGSVSLLAFAGFLLFGPPVLLRLNAGEAGTLWLDATLCMLFFVQHTGMVRKSTRRWIAGFLPGNWGGAVYAIASGLALLLLIVLWQESSRVVVELSGPARWGARALSLLALLGFAWGARSLGGFDPLGVQSIRHFLRGTTAKTLPFCVTGPYRLVRHPLYLFTLVLLWTNPDLTADRLLLNVLFTAWIAVGAVLEERDLLREIGPAYREYRRLVPMLVPWPGLPTRMHGSQGRSPRIIFPMADPRAILFDLDDTIADTCGTILRAAERAAVRALIDHGLRTDFDTGWAALREIRDANPGVRFLGALVTRFGADDPDACHDAAREVFFASRPEEIGPVEGAHEVLAALADRGIALHLVTFGVPAAQTRKIEVLGIRDFFVSVHIVPFTDGPDKTEVFRSIVDANGLEPSEVWVVGDRPPGEIRAGNALGLRTVRVRQGEFAALEPTGPEEVPDVTIEALRELPSLLN